MTVRVTVRRRGSLEADMLDDIQTKLLDLHRVLVQKSPVKDDIFRPAWTVDTNTLSIDNNTEYAEALAEGHSPQARKGWVDESITDIFE